MDIKQALSPNFTVGRRKNIIAIVDHITAGAFPGCLTWMQNPKSQASAHYLVTRQGEVYQLVRDANVAWHAGIANKPNWPLYDGSNPNQYTIGIEHEGFQTAGGDGNLTEVQYQASLELHRMLTAMYSIPVDADHIIGHYRIDAVNRPNCPGPKFPWDRLLSDLNESEDEMRYVTVKDLPEWAKATIEKLISKGALAGDGSGQLNLSEDMVRMLVINDRMGVYGGDN